MLYLAAVCFLCFKCSVGASRKNAWLIAIPFAVGIAASVLLATGKMPKINGSYLFELPETLIFMAACMLECCMQLGLIPTNQRYWVELLYRTEYIDEPTYTALNNQCTAIRVMLIASCRTAKQNNQPN